MTAFEYGITAVMKDGHTEATCFNGICLNFAQGQMVLELFTEQSLELITGKVKHWINLIQNKDAAVSEPAVASALGWVLSGVNVSEGPVFTESMIRGEFAYTVAEMEQAAENEGINIGRFFLACYKAYIRRFTKICTIVDALASVSSGIADERKGQIAESYESVLDDIFEQKKRMLQVPGTREAFNIVRFEDLLLFEYHSMHERGKVFKVCENCHRYFAPFKRNTKYCSYPSPQDANIPCRIMAPRLRDSRNRREDPEKAERNRENARRAATEKRVGDQQRLMELIKQEYKKMGGIQHEYL